MASLARIVSGTEWSHFSDYLSPSFFEVVPARSLSRVLGSLSTNAMRPRKLRGVRRDRDHSLARAGLALSLDASRSAPVLGELALGDVVLSLYFHQLEAGGVALLDLRASAFVVEQAQVQWQPAGLIHRWEPRFHRALCQLYRGFYSEEAAVFDAALAELELEPARDIFLAHFGGGDQRSVRFDMATFHDTFHQAFVACRDAGVELHGDFIALGLYLATLYEHLEALGGAWDVRAAWERAAAA